MGAIPREAAATREDVLPGGRFSFSYITVVQEFEIGRKDYEQSAKGNANNSHFIFNAYPEHLLSLLDDSNPCGLD
jgi:hypothetical protein